MTTSSRYGVIDWLLEGDPSIRWQAMRDLTEAKETTFELERPGKPSRWNTLRALRILKRWDEVGH
jgi:hypothetical protein